MPLIDILLAGAITPDKQTIIEMLVHESIVLHVDPVLAVTIALLESGLDPHAIGDYMTSFGLFQLHEGGELGTMTAEEAFDPVLNARTALPYIAHAQAPGLTPGAIAAAAQRPLYRNLYALQVNTMYPLVKQVLSKLGVMHG